MNDSEIEVMNDRLLLDGVAQQVDSDDVLSTWSTGHHPPGEELAVMESAQDVVDEESVEVLAEGLEEVRDERAAEEQDVAEAAEVVAATAKQTHKVETPVGKQNAVQGRRNKKVKVAVVHPTPREEDEVTVVGQVNEGRRRRRSGCWLCGQAGHIAGRCPQFSTVKRNTPFLVSSKGRIMASIRFF